MFLLIVTGWHNVLVKIAYWVVHTCQSMQRWHKIIILDKPFIKANQKNLLTVKMCLVFVHKLEQRQGARSWSSLGQAPPLQQDHGETIWRSIIYDHCKICARQTEMHTLLVVHR